MFTYMFHIQQPQMKGDSATKPRPSLMLLFFVAVACFVHLLLAVIQELIFDMERGSSIIETGVLMVAMLLPLMCLSVPSWHTKAAPKDARKACDEKDIVMYDQDVATVMAGIHRAVLACRRRKAVNQRQQQGMTKNSPTKPRLSLMFLSLVALMCLVDLLLEKLIFDIELGSFMMETGILMVALLLPTMCFTVANWHKLAERKDARKDCREKEILVHDYKDVATVAAGIHQAGWESREQTTVNRQQYHKNQYGAVMDLNKANHRGKATATQQKTKELERVNVDVQNAALSAAVSAVAKHAFVNPADVHVVGQRHVKQLQLEHQAAQEQGGTWRHRQQQGQLQQQRLERQRLQQRWPALPPQPQPGVCVREPQLVTQSHHGNTAPGGRKSTCQPLYVKAGVRPSKSGPRPEARVPR